MSANVDVNHRPDPDQVLVDIADYVCNHPITSQAALDTARYCLMDTLGCGLLALRFPECTKHLGPIVPGTVVPFGARYPAPSSASTPSRRPGISVPSSAGSITTTPGWPPSGVTLRQPGWHPRHRRLALPYPGGRRQGAAHHERCADGHGEGP